MIGAVVIGYCPSVEETGCCEGACSLEAPGAGVFGCEFEGTRYDAGTTMGWLQASVELALQRTDLAGEFREYLRALAL